MRTNRSIQNLRDDIKKVLGRMKLNALAQELEKQYDQPNWEKMTFERRLVGALESVYEHRCAANFNKLMEAAHLSPDLCLANFDDYWETPAREQYSHTVRQLQTGEWLVKERPTNLVVVGPSGSGKSWLASAFAREACHLGLKVQYVENTKDLLGGLIPSHPEATNLRLLNKVIKSHLLILDDFLNDDLNAHECHWLYRILQSRYQRRACIFLSQIPVEAWHSLLPSGPNNDSFLDRLLSYSHYIELKEEKSLRNRLKF